MDVNMNVNLITGGLAGREQGASRSKNFNGNNRCWDLLDVSCSCSRGVGGYFGIITSNPAQMIVCWNSNDGKIGNHRALKTRVRQI